MNVIHILWSKFILILYMTQFIWYILYHQPVASVTTWLHEVSLLNWAQLTSTCAWGVLLPYSNRTSHTTSLKLPQSVLPEFLVWHPHPAGPNAEWQMILWVPLLWHFGVVLKTMCNGMNNGQHHGWSLYQAMCIAKRGLSIPMTLLFPSGQG